MFSSTACTSSRQGDQELSQQHPFRSLSQLEEGTLYPCQEGSQRLDVTHNGLSELETTVETLSITVCVKWSHECSYRSRKNTIHNFVRTYEAASDSVPDHIITGEKLWCHHYKQTAVHRGVICEFLIKEVQDAALSG